MRNLRIAAAVGAIWGAAAGAASAQDTIKLANATTVQGRITKLTSKDVTYVAGGKSITLPRSEYTDFIFSDTPPSLPMANTAAAEQRWEKAFAWYEKALTEATSGKHRDLHKQFVLWHWAEALRGKGDTDGALAMLQRLRKECGDCHKRPDAYHKALEYAKGKGAATYQAILEEMKAEPDPLGGEAELELAGIAFAGGNHDEALALYTKLSGKSDGFTAGAAKLGVFRCLKALKKTADLDALCQKVLADRGDGTPALAQAAGAWVARTMLQKAAKDRVKVRDAFLVAARAIVVGPPDRRDEAEDYVDALRVAARCSAILGETAAGAEQKAEYRARAAGYLTEIVRVYKGTEWAESALQELKELGVEDK
jgi:tetratricopeptide (TPR) repeat protein